MCQLPNTQGFLAGRMEIAARLREDLPTLQQEDPAIMNYTSDPVPGAGIRALLQSGKKRGKEKNSL